MELIRLIVVDYMTLSTIQTSSTTLKKNALSDIVNAITCLGIHVRNKKKVSIAIHILQQMITYRI